MKAQAWQVWGRSTVWKKYVRGWKPREWRQRIRKIAGYERPNLLIDNGASVDAIPSHVAAGVAELPMQPGERLEYYTASGQTVKATAKNISVLDFQQGAR